MTDTTEATNATPKKKSKMKKIILLLLGLLVIGGGGAGAGLYAMNGSILGGGHAEEEDADQPHLVVREGVSDPVVAEARVRARTAAPDPRVFQATYFPMETNFTSNLRGGTAFVQVGLGVSTYYDERVLENLRTHDMAIRSAVLMTLSEQDPVAITTNRGRQELKEALRNTINNVLTIREGFGGIDDVYFTSFVTQ